MHSSIFRRRVWAWYHSHGRHKLPWRTTHNPYRILVSEVMLQQTQVARVLPKYTAFLKTFPSFKVLARAPLPKLLKLWQGLGYNRRALNLRKLAQVVVGKHKGKLPESVPELEQLPGIGPYTARAVAALAFNTPVALLETNIRKVMLHEFFPKRRSVPDREVMAVLERLLDQARPRDWNLALMDYGAAHFVGPAKNPNLRSTTYAKQSTFKNSRRMLRGRVVAWLSEQGSGTTAGLKRHLVRVGLPNPLLEQLPGVLLDLTQEGFIRKQGGRYRLAL